MVDVDFDDVDKSNGCKICLRVYKSLSNLTTIKSLFDKLFKLNTRRALLVALSFVTITPLKLPQILRKLVLHLIQLLAKRYLLKAIKFFLKR